MPMGSRRENLIDGEEVTQLWVKMGSIKKILNLFTAEGRVNPNTGNPFTTSGLWRSAMLFIVTNPEKGRDYYRQAQYVFTDSDWEKFLLRKAMLIYNNQRSTFLRWVIDQPDQWPRKYEHFYKDKFNVRSDDDYEYFKQTERKLPEHGMLGYYKSKGEKSLPE